MLIELRRHCEAVLIPSGEKTILLKGDGVYITQNMGGNFTVRTHVGQLVRIAGWDSDALGIDLSAISNEVEEEDTGEFEISKVWNKLSSIFDPEIPVNIVDLGLIYSCEAYALDSGGYRVEIKMTMTAPGCGMGDILKEEAISKISSIRDVREVDVEIVLEPAWDRSRMSEAAMLQLGMF